MAMTGAHLELTLFRDSLRADIIPPMLDFKAVRTKRMTLAELAAGLTKDDLRALTNEMVDTMQDLIKGCTDADVVFTPLDPAAKDDAAATEDERYIAWGLGHLIVHCTASTEEAAFLAAELARGVPHHGRSRYETHWTTVTTIQQCRDRLEENRRMRLATIDVWPDEPHVDLTYEPYPNAGPRNCYAYFIGGLSHDDSHLNQIREVVRQAHAARAPA
jgi:hypothetical protein